MGSEDTPKIGRVRIVREADPSATGCHIINAMRKRLTGIRIRKFMDLDPLRPAFGVPFATAIAISADQSYPFGFDEIVD